MTHDPKGERWQFGRDRWVDPQEMTPTFVAGRLLLTFSEGDSYVIDTPLQQLLVATFHRSSKTYRGIMSLVLDELGTQAAMLARSLFEDVVVAHWLLYNREDPDWLVARFERHRDAMALYQHDLVKRTSWRMGDLLVEDPSALRARQNALVKEFGWEATKNWWDPGAEGRGVGKPIGLRGVAEILERAAIAHEAFHPRFGGGEEPLLVRMDLVAQKWFSQALHHTVIGLPFAVTEAGGLPTEQGDPTQLVEFVTWWLYAQQLYLLHDLYGRPYDDLQERIEFGFVHAFGAEPGDLKPFAP